MDELRRAREAAGLTQAALAALTGVAASNVSAYETGRRRASPAMRRRLLAAATLPSQRLAAHREGALALIARRGGENPRVFGSVATGRETPSSDIDLLVRVPPERAWDSVALRPELEELLGVRVDLVSEGGLQARHQDILDQAVPL
ncbi:MAG: XRE family transcriptional regulator [Bifidobacteriaceae bacterium]|jgi:predicted nucleotidyltransferase|nr:XRE family transcriptional regulator [Bifidobacteriaceae bacterium]